MTTRIIRIAACVGALATLALQPEFGGGASTVGSEFGAHAAEQSARRDADAHGPRSAACHPWAAPAKRLAVNESGTVIVGSSWDRRDVWHAMKWTLQNGAWTGISLPRPPSANSAVARGVNNNGDVGGNDFPGPTAHAVLWPSGGGFTVLGCSGALLPETVYAIATSAQVVVGAVGLCASSPRLWRPGGACRETLPVLAAGRSGSAYAVNADGSVVGGTAESVVAGSAFVPVRWRKLSGGWLIEQLDSRAGGVFGANAIGDLVGRVDAPCSPGAAVSAPSSGTPAEARATSAPSAARTAGLATSMRRERWSGRARRRRWATPLISGPPRGACYSCPSKDVGQRPTR